MPFAEQDELNRLLLRTAQGDRVAFAELYHRMALQAGSLAQLGPTAKLAVSVEPPGGSPTGQPTGAVIGIGAIREVPSS